MDEDHFVFYTSGSLQKMAAHTVALKIWQHYLLRSAYYKNQPFSDLDDLGRAFKLSTDFQLRCNELVKNLQIPKPIENILMKSLKYIQTEISAWIYSFEDFVFDEGLRRYMYRVRRIDVNCCVWTPDCDIDYVKTASKMLCMEELNKIQKFIIMCKYFLENEIRSFPYHSLRSNTLKLLFSDTMLQYWMCELEGERFCMTIEDMINFCNGYNRYAFQYFWERLSAEKQVIVAAEILPSACGNQQLSLLPKLSDWHQRKLICRVPGVIMKNFICWLDMPENAYLCWKKTKDIMTNEEFLRLVFQLLRVVREEDGTEHVEDCHALLLHIWDTASDRLKNRVFMVFDDIAHTFLHKFQNHSKSGLIFIRRLLRLKTPEYRKSFMLENAIQFTTNVPVLDAQSTSE